MPRLQEELRAAQQAAEAAGRRAEEAESRAKTTEEAAATAAATASAAAAAPAQPGPASQPTSPPNSHAAVSAAVAAALGGGGSSEPGLDDLLSPGGTTLRFAGPTVGYAEAVAASPPQAPTATGRGSRPTSVSPPSGGRGPAGRLPHSRGESISSEIEPADDAGGAQASAAARPPRAGSAGAAPQDAAQLAAAQARVAALERELADSERTHSLRDRATAVLKEEIAELR